MKIRQVKYFSLILMFFLILTGFFDLVYCANSPENENSEQLVVQLLGAGQFVL